MSGTRPVPQPDELSAPYWAAAQRHESMLPRCASCAQFDLPPEIVCRRCGSTSPEWSHEVVSGRGAIRSWTIVRKSNLSGLPSPFVIVDVELDEQDDLRVIGRLADGADATLEIGARVETDFEDVDENHTVPVFRLAGP